MAAPVSADSDSGSPEVSVAKKKGKRKLARAAKLLPFGGCESVADYGDAEARRVFGNSYRPKELAPYPVQREGTLASPVSGQANRGAAEDGGTDFSTTNVQETDVDEPDIVKTNGRTIFAIGGNSLNAVDARSPNAPLLGSLRLQGWGHQLLLAGSRLLVISEKLELPESIEPPPLPDPPPPPSRWTGSEEPLHPDAEPVTVLSEIDVSDPRAMRLVRSEEVDGHNISARLTGDQIRVVITTPPAATIAPDSSLRSKVAGWVPYFKLTDWQSGETTRGPVLDSCSEVTHPTNFSGLNMLSVLTIDMTHGLPAVDAEGVMSDGEIVYASASGLYVATQRWWAGGGSAARPNTAIHKFDISKPDSTTYQASGLIRGWLRNQFSMSELDGVLRVVHTDQVGSGTDSQVESFLTTLRQSGSLLAPVGSVGNIGRGERVYAVRMLGETGYVVTFQQIDPLFTLDLSDPSNPRRVGELEIPGYSAYLHPISDTLLLGVGAAATPLGVVLGTQVSLFDVSDLANPRRLAVQTIQGARTSIEETHHAFLYWPKTNFTLIPVDARMRHKASSRFVGGIGFKVGEDSINRVGRVTHEGVRFDELLRSLVVGDRVFTLSCTGIEAAEMDHLRQLSWTPFQDPDACLPSPFFFD